ncbi:hypothetical protein RFI_27051 [Reticulomyxa filosa]|uniref:Uncharacterized protein n=1 Tax=Reticulomyxa filosa TaxID=46433 RepID=X6M8L4_RETFI|nr:hypothetical protein RFI_27051 [Reticulomyxa filosa]|eukprot:ETO10328.1 hypothetical protein RFI_27051 [Reticulomyxa filosa]
MQRKRWKLIVEYETQQCGFNDYPTVLLDECAKFSEEYEPKLRFMIVDDLKGCLKISDDKMSVKHNSTGHSGVVHICDSVTNFELIDSFMYMGMFPHWLKNKTPFDIGSPSFPACDSLSRFYTGLNTTQKFEWIGDIQTFRARNNVEIKISIDFEANHVQLTNVTKQLQITLKPIPDNMETIAFYLYWYDLTIIQQSCQYK